MTDRVQEAMKDVWTWKRQAEEATREMSAAELIDFYRRQAQDVERRLGVHLKTRRASDITQTRP
jgi:hypothetical protein